MDFLVTRRIWHIQRLLEMRYILGIWDQVWDPITNDRKENMYVFNFTKYNFIVLIAYVFNFKYLEHFSTYVFSW